MLRQLLAASLFLLGCTQARPGGAPEKDAGPASHDASQPTADAGGAGGGAVPRDASQPGQDAGGKVPTEDACQPAKASDRAAPMLASAQLIRGPAGIVAMTASNGAFRALLLDDEGTPVGSDREVWSGVRSSSEATLAISGDVLAMAIGATDASERRVCQFALASLSDLSQLAPPTRFSDPPDGATILNEADFCSIVGIDDGFMLVWQQFVSNTSVEMRLFAQQIGRDGKPTGERLTLVEGLQKPGEPGLAGDGERVFIVHEAERSGDRTLFTIEGGRVTRGALELPGSTDRGRLRLQAAHHGLLLQSGSSVWTLDPDGRAVAGPRTMRPEGLIAPLGDGFVVLEHAEFLTATTLDARLEAPSNQLGISTDRGAYARALVGPPEGSKTLLVYQAEGATRLTRLTCGDTDPAPLGPQSCPAKEPLAPLDDGCEDAVCQVAIRLDALTLGVRGWTATGGAKQPMTSTQVGETAARLFTMKSEYVSNPPEVTGPTAGVYLAWVDPSDFGAIALIGADNGAVIAAGGVVWSGMGNYWVPETWRSADAIACGKNGIQPAETFLGGGYCTDDPKMKPKSASAALDVALRTNLAAHVATRGPVAAYVHMYLPTVGACNPRVAEYLVVLTTVH
ncbi:MAG TPA: hypothetical protein VJV78_39340 [Polyangiales bacterium]|nr:hypothetical protein [Polyangiales bacterium]